MANFDIRSLLTNIPLTEALNVCVQNIYVNQRLVDNLNKSSFNNLLNFTLFESFFIFYKKFYEQCNNIAMGSTVGPTLTKVFMRHFENFWLENCPCHFKWSFCRCFVNEYFLLFWTKSHVKKCKSYPRKQHKNLKFMSYEIS